MRPAKRESDRSISAVCRVAASPVPAVAVLLRTRRQEPAAPPASMDSAERGSPPVAAGCRRGLALAQSVRHGESGADAGVARKPGRQVKIKPAPATHRGTPPLGLFVALQHSLAEPFAILENATLPVLSNTTEMVDLSGNYNPWTNLKVTMELPANRRRERE